MAVFFSYCAINRPHVFRKYSVLLFSIYNLPGANIVLFADN
jgi:hypothetical protein